MPVGHHLSDVSVGLWISNSSASRWNVAVVSSARTFEPWPSSVCAYAPKYLAWRAPPSHAFFCASLACVITKVRNMLKWMPPRWHEWNMSPMATFCWMWSIMKAGLSRVICTAAATRASLDALMSSYDRK